MFGLFKSKKKEITVKDLVLKSDTAKYKGLVRRLNQSDKVIILYYFEDTKEELENYLDTQSIQYTTTNSFAAKVWIMKANSILQKSDVNNRDLLFIEHHPSFKKEKEITDHIMNNLSVNEVTFFVSLEDELLKFFGSDRISDMMEKMGFKDDDALEHTMISKSIERTQMKMDESVLMPSDTRNSKDWFTMNLK